MAIRLPFNPVTHRSIRRLGERGFDEVTLGVDAENPTGAVRVYAKADMSVRHTQLTWRRVMRGAREDIRDTRAG